MRYIFTALLVVTSAGCADDTPDNISVYFVDPRTCDTGSDSDTNDGMAELTMSFRWRQDGANPSVLAPAQTGVYLGTIDLKATGGKPVEVSRLVLPVFGRNEDMDAFRTEVTWLSVFDHCVLEGVNGVMGGPVSQEWDEINFGVDLTINPGDMVSGDVRCDLTVSSVMDRLLEYAIELPVVQTTRTALGDMLVSTADVVVFGNRNGGATPERWVQLPYNKYHACTRAVEMVDGRTVDTDIYPWIRWDNVPYDVMLDTTPWFGFTITDGGCDPRFAIESLDVSFREYSLTRDFMSANAGATGEGSLYINGYIVDLGGQQSYINTSAFTNAVDHTSYYGWRFNSPVASGFGYTTNLLPVSPGATFSFGLLPSSFDYMSSIVSDEAMVVVEIEVSARVRSLVTGDVWTTDASRETFIAHMNQ